MSGSPGQVVRVHSTEPAGLGWAWLLYTYYVPSEANAANLGPHFVLKVWISFSFLVTFISLRLFFFFPKAYSVIL